MTYGLGHGLALVGGLVLVSAGRTELGRTRVRLRDRGAGSKVGMPERLVGADPLRRLKREEFLEQIDRCVRRGYVPSGWTLG